MNNKSEGLISCGGGIIILFALVGLSVFVSTAQVMVIFCTILGWVSGGHNACTVWSSPYTPVDTVDGCRGVNRS